MKRLIQFLFVVIPFVINYAFSKIILQESNSFPSISIDSLMEYQPSETKTVFGFLPYWEYLAGTHKTIDYSLLTHVAVMAFEADSLGNITPPLNWPWIDVINSSRQNKCKIILTVANFEGTEINKLMSDTITRENLFNNLAKYLFPYSLDGINFDFENLLDSDKGEVVINFLKLANSYFKTINPDLEISFSTPIVNDGKWDFKRMSENCDYLFAMGYDFYGSWSETTGPSAPFSGPFFSISKAVLNDYKPVTDYNSQKLILGVPYYGNYWKTDSEKPYASVKRFSPDSLTNNWQKIILYRDLPNYKDAEYLWDEISQTPWLRWKDSTWNQIWFEDTKSVELKFELAVSQKLRGIGIWALGYDYGSRDFWNLIKTKFFDLTSLNNEVQPDNGFLLYQNYPNPFNPETTIRYSVPKIIGKSTSKVSLKIYDILGNEIAILVNEEKIPGIHTVKFASYKYELASGIYCYRLVIDKLAQSRIMTFIK